MTFMCLSHVSCHIDPSQGVPLPLRLVAARNLLALEAACVSDAKV
jgi:hypothetical protein